MNDPDRSDPADPQTPAGEKRGRRSGGFRAFSRRAEKVEEAAGKTRRPKRIERLDGNFTIHEAQQILRAEGGELTVHETVVQVLWTLFLFGSLAWAIIVGNATIWHMAVPLVVEYMTGVVGLPLLLPFFRHPELGREARKCLVLIAILLVAAVIATAVRSARGGLTWMEQLRADGAFLQEWIFGHHLQWAMLISAVHMMRGLIRNARFLIRHGPPFMGPGMGCGMRFAVLFLALIIVPPCAMALAGLFKGSSLFQHLPGWLLNPAWLLWSVLLVADLCYLWFRWDIQSRLKKKGYRIEPEIPENIAT